MSDDSKLLSSLPIAALVALAVVLPFDLTFLRVSLPASAGGDLLLTPVEIAAAVVLVSWALRQLLGGWPMGGWPNRGWLSARPTPLTWAALSWVAVAYLSAWNAIGDQGRSESVRFALRLTGQVAVFLAAASILGVSRNSPRRALADGLTFGATIGALLALCDLLWPEWAPLRLPDALPTHAAGRVRATGTFAHATTAALYLEILLPVAVAAAAAASARRAPIYLRLGAAWIIALGLFATGSRAATLSVTALMVALTWMSRRWPTLRPLWIPAGSTSFVLLIAISISAFDRDRRAQFVSETDASWFGARYEAPESFELESGAVATLPMIVTNTGRFTWRPDGPDAVRLEARWLDASGDSVLDLPVIRSAIGREAAPGDSLHFRVVVRAPEVAGRYRLSLGMDLQGTGAFRYRDVAERVVTLEVQEGVGGPRRADASQIAVVGGADDRSLAVLPLSRIQLWRAAAALWAERPWLGVGPDRFRTFYGRALGLRNWDDGLGPHPFPLQLLCEMGLVGAAAGLWFWALCARRLSRALRRSLAEGAGARRPLWLVGGFGGFAVAALHGCVDGALGNHSVGLALGLTLALALSAAEE